MIITSQETVGLCKTNARMKIKKLFQKTNTISIAIRYLRNTVSKMSKL